MKIKVVESVLQANDAVAQEIRKSLTKAGVLAVNLMSAPGSGKTTLLEKTIVHIGPEKCAVMVGDLQTSRDAERLGATGAVSVQINTGKGCHLSAVQVLAGMNDLDLGPIEYLFIENVGNMVCPAGYDLGEHHRVALLSVPEGDDKVAKYWTLFQGVDVILLTKADLLKYLDFNRERVKLDLSKINTQAPLYELTVKGEDSLHSWYNWLSGKRRDLFSV